MVLGIQVLGVVRKLLLYQQLTYSYRATLLYYIHGNLIALFIVDV
jgi:hypothetical protein